VYYQSPIQYPPLDYMDDDIDYLPPVYYKKEVPVEMPLQDYNIRPYPRKLWPKNQLVPMRIPTQIREPYVLSEEPPVVIRHARSVVKHKKQPKKLKFLDNQYYLDEDTSLLPPIMLVLT